MSKLVRQAENGFVIIAFLFGLEPTIWGEFLVNKWYLYVYPLTLLFGLLRWKRVLLTATRDIFVFLMVLVALISTLWTVKSGATNTAIFHLIFTTLFGYYVAARYTLRELLILLAIPFGIATFLSIFYSVAMPSIGVMGASQAGGIHAGSWKGIFEQKNPLARNMCVTGAMFLCLTDIFKPRYRWICWVGFAIAAIVIQKSGSGTGLVTLANLIVLFPLYRALRWSNTLLIPLTIVGIIICGTSGIWLVDNAAAAAASIGKDLTFTGRDKLWSNVILKISEKPWLGYGYGGFWLGWEGESADVWRELTWRPPHAHNGVLEVWLNLGLLGVAVFLLGFVVNYIQALKWVRMSKSGEGVWPLLYLTFMFFYNISQDITAEGKSLFWVLYVILSASMRLRPHDPIEPEEFTEDDPSFVISDPPEPVKPRNYR